MVQIGQQQQQLKTARRCSFRRVLQSLLLLLAALCYLMVSTVHKLQANSTTGEGTLNKEEPLRPIQESVVSKHSDEDIRSKRNDSIAYVVTITGCDKPRENVDPFPIAEGALVLQHSIARASASSKKYPNFQMYAIYHPVAAPCAETLGPLGYTLLKRETPVKVEEIQGDFLRENIQKNGCCGEKELVKFEAWTLTQHRAIVLLDLDALLLQPLDAALDLLLERKLPPEAEHHLMYPEKPLPEEINVLHTIDYAMVNPGRKIKPFQGGFAILKPNLTIYNEFVKLMRLGDFRASGGWGGKSGKFWGGQTFQGLMPYYYHILHAQDGGAVELDWCTYNNMGSPSRNDGVKNDRPSGKCYTQQEDCQDCREKPLEEVITTHFTVCQKPWTCLMNHKDAIDKRLCRKFHHEWFRARSELESSWGRPGMGSGDWDKNHFYGYCEGFGKKGYKLIAQPYGTKATT